MTSGSSSTSTLLYVILALCILNSAGLAYVIVSRPASSSDSATPSRIPLPQDLRSSGQRSSYFERLKQMYNAKDYDTLYAELDEVARLEVPKEKLIESVDILHSYAGEIESGAYNYYEINESTQGVKNFTLNFSIKTDKGKGVFKISLFQQHEEPYRLAGIHINMK